MAQDYNSFDYIILSLALSLLLPTDVVTSLPDGRHSSLESVNKKKHPEKI